MRGREFLGLCALALALPSCAGEGASGPAVEPLFEMSRQAGAPPLNFAPTELAPQDVLLVGATILTAAGPPIEGGSLLIQGGQITAVSSEAIEAPEGVRVVDLKGRFLTPGLIDTHSHLGVYPAPHVEAHSDGNEATAPTTPEVSVEHAIWPQDPGFWRAVAGGVTTQQVLPGSANVIGGRSLTIKSHPGISARAMRFPGAPQGLKMACGENPKRLYGSKGRQPSTRMGNLAVWRGAFQSALEYGQAVERFERSWLEWERQEGRDPLKEPAAPKRDLGLETLLAAMRGEILVHVHCYRADEMIQVLELAEAYGFSVRSLHHAVEAYKIRDVLAEWQVSVSTWADWWGFKMAAHDAVLENAALISAAGGRAIIHSDSSVGIQRLNQEAAKAYHAGLQAGIEVTEEDALRWITLNAAWALGVDAVTGSLEVGKMGDVVVWDGPPLSVYARPVMVFVDGVLEYDRAAEGRWSDFEVYMLPEGLEGETR